MPADCLSFSGSSVTNALAKFDFNSDGYIDRRDPVFEKLRLWRDDNHDGIVQQHELFTLTSLGVEVIDLRYDKRYFEIDKWGNQIRYKSVLKTSDQKLHFVFDVWLRYLD